MQLTEISNESLICFLQKLGKHFDNYTMGASIVVSFRNNRLRVQTQIANECVVVSTVYFCRHKHLIEKTTLNAESAVLILREIMKNILENRVLSVHIHNGDRQLFWLL